MPGPYVLGIHQGKLFWYYTKAQDDSEESSSKTRILEILHPVAGEDEGTQGAFAMIPFWLGEYRFLSQGIFPIRRNIGRSYGNTNAEA
jgi:hypothetical protein